VAKQPKQFRWRIPLIRATPARYLGPVMAGDADAAIRKAITEFAITDPERQKRLIAQREG